MIRLVTLLVRKPGTTHEEFLTHWHERHGPLVRSLASAKYIRRYEQHPAAWPPAGQRAARARVRRRDDPVVRQRRVVLGPRCRARQRADDGRRRAVPRLVEAPLGPLRGTDGGDRRPRFSDLTGRQNALPSTVMGDQGIELGTMLFTMVEPSKGHEVEYNRWYERDHFYAGCMVGPYTFAGDRFVATKRLKDLRYPAGSPMTPDPQQGSYLALYWVLAGHHDDWNRWSVDTVTWLHANGRMFTERKHVHTVLYDFGWSVQAAERGTSAELALDRHYAGLVVNVGELTEGSTLGDVETWTRTAWAPTAMAAPWGPDLVAQRHAAAAARRCPCRRPARRERRPAFPPAPLRRPRSRRRLGRRLWPIRRRAGSERDRHPPVDRPVHPDRVRDRHVHRRALVSSVSDDVST